MPTTFADLHCHPTMYPFNRMRNRPNMEADPDMFHPWRMLPSNLRHMERGYRAASYTQSSFAQLTRGNVRLVFAALSPIERGFFGVGPDGQRHPFVLEALRILTGATIVKSGVDLVRRGRKQAMQEITKILRNDGPLRVLLDSLYVRHPSNRIRYILSEEYDYWHELHREYEFLCSLSGQRQDASVPSMRDGGFVEEMVNGCYHVVPDRDQLERIIERKAGEIAVVTSIEGGHVFSIGPDHKPVEPELMIERIGELRALSRPIFFITLAHHFDNGVCGHCRSIPDAGRLVIDQEARLGQGLERQGDLGIRVIRELLDLDDDLTDRGGRRILIDIKHMSARSRKEYYAKVLRPYNARWEARQNGDGNGHRPKIPIVASHVAYSGIQTLDEMIANEEHENDHWHVGPYYAWSINLSDEDVRMAHDSEGLIGLIFDRRVVGVGPGEQVPDELWPRVLMQQIFGIVDVIFRDDRLDAAAKRTIWDRLCIGTDFDGVMHPVPLYPTVLEFDRFAGHVADALSQYRHTRMIDEIGIDEIVEKTSWRNAYEFTRRHFPER